LWIEAKHKTVWSWYRKGSRWETGIDRHHYKQYCEVEQRLGLPVWLLFLHSQSTPWASDLRMGCPSECPTGLFGEQLAVLTGKISHESNRHGPTGMMYWAHHSLRKIASLETILEHTR